MSTARGYELNINGLVTEINFLKTKDNTPVGTVIWSANAVVPVGYLLCNGSLVSRTDYKELFDVIGTTFGSGDGETTFALPNLIGRFIEGDDEAGEVKEAGLPNISGEASLGNAGVNSNIIGYWGGSGAFASGTTASGNVVTASTGTSAQRKLLFDASLSNPIYGNSNTVQPPSVTALPCIKAFSYALGSTTVDEIANLVASKLSLDGSNVGSIGNNLKEYMANMGMPSDKYITYTVTQNPQAYIAPADGYFSLWTSEAPSDTWIVLRVGEIGEAGSRAVETIVRTGYQMPLVLAVRKNEQVVLQRYTSVPIGIDWFGFIYANGSKHLAPQS